jgi:hypothetical protein
VPKLDQCHYQIVRALQKAGWSVSPNPYVLRVERRRLYIDIYAQMIQPEQPRRIIVVEAKCFTDVKDEVNEFYTTVGQYLTYRGLLEQIGETIDLYLAIPLRAYEGVFQEFAMSVTSKIHIKMIVVDLDREVVERWLE